MPLFDRAINILAELSTEEELGTKPICFITHSMGGLLVKQMLCNASEDITPEFKKFGNAARGLIFIATPHTGSGLSKLNDYLGFFLRTTIAVRELKSFSADLRKLNLWYRNNAGRLGIQTYVLYEKEKTSGVLVVDESSADPGIAGVTPIPIDSNHVNIVKPASLDEPVYRLCKQFVLSVLSTDRNPSENQIMAIHPAVVSKDSRFHRIAESGPLRSIEGSEIADKASWDFDSLLDALYLLSTTLEKAKLSTNNDVPFEAEEVPANFVGRVQEYETLG
jgi:hypothetical protein